MNGSEISKLREMLLNRRRELLTRVKSLQAGWDEMKEVAIELEEEAQKLSITEPLDRLDKEGKEEIERIDLALRKIPLGEYGICENCSDDISTRRMEAIPHARLCIDCAREFEKRGVILGDPSEMLVSTGPSPSSEQTITAGRLPDDFDGLTDTQIASRVLDRIQKDDRIDTDELDIHVEDGVLYLEGVLPGVPEHQIVMQIVTDVLGFADVVDQIVLDEVPWEREDRTPGKEDDGVSATDKLLYGEENVTEDLYEADSQDAYSPPDGPMPHQEQDPVDR